MASLNAIMLPKMTKPPRDYNDRQGFKRTPVRAMTATGNIPEP